MLQIELIRHVKVDGKAGLYGKTDILPVKDENESLLAALHQRAIDSNNHSLSKQNGYLPYYDAVISSPLKRCSIVANKLSDMANVTLSIEAGLQEMDFGLYDGLSFDEIPFTEEPCETYSHKKTLYNTVNKSYSTDSSDKLLYVENTQQITMKTSGLNWPQLEKFFKEPAKITLPEAESLSDFHKRVINTWQKILSKQLLLLDESQQNNSEPVPRRVAIFAHGGVIRMILAHALSVDWQNASWYQNLHIDYASLSQVTVSSLSHSYSEDKIEIPNESKRYFQQVNTIGMPLIIR